MRPVFSNPRKREARRWWIERARDLLDVDQLGPTDLIVTLGGPQADQTGVFNLDAEVWDLVGREGIAQAPQIICVEQDRERFEINQQIAPGCHHVHAELSSFLSTAEIRTKLNGLVRIINADQCIGPQRPGAFDAIIEASRYRGPLVVVGNFVRHAPRTLLAEHKVSDFIPEQLPPPIDSLVYDGFNGVQMEQCLWFIPGQENKSLVVESVATA